MFKYVPPLILAGVNMFLLTYQIPTSYHNLFLPLIDSLDPIPPYLYSSQPIYPTHIVLLTVPHMGLPLLPSPLSQTHLLQHQGPCSAHVPGQVVECRCQRGCYKSEHVKLYKYVLQ